MSKILLVDDEPDYRDHLGLYFSARGHHVRTASSGREAIGLGVGYQPDILVADWMLMNHIHGLHVCETLRMVHPRLQTVLITGFPSSDLRAEARRMRVAAFLEKPFDPEQIEASLADGPDEAPGPDSSRIAILEVDAEDCIAFANEQARRLFAQTPAGRDARSLDQVFGVEERGRLCVSSHRWVAVSPRGNDPRVWHARSRPGGEPGRRILIILAADDLNQRHHPAVRMLLDSGDAAPARWPLDKHVLIVDDEEIVRRATMAQLDRVGCLCHAADSAESALRLLERDAQISFVVLDYSMPGTDVGRLIEDLRRLRPGITLIGNSGLDRREDFQALGVSRFLAKPWRAEDLIDLVNGRIRECAECGLALPLRRPRPGEVVEAWACQGCGARHLAVLDSDAAPETLSHVRRMDPE